MKYKLFVIKFFKYFLILTISIVLINFIVDPLFIFKVSQQFDIKNKDFNERVQKTNYLAYIDNDFDSILLGNSRATYINTKRIDKKIGGKVFNYAVNAMSSSEYDKVIQNFIKLTHKVPKVIFIGLDPFHIGNNNSENIQNALKNISDKYYPFKQLLSLDLLKFSIRGLNTTYEYYNNIFDRKERFYDRKLTKGLQTINTISNKNNIIAFKNSNIRIDPKANLDILTALVQKYNQSKFIIFTMPIQDVVLDKYFKHKSYILWLKNLVNIFGTVNHFMYHNNISKSYYAFFDGFHFYPYVGNKIVENIASLPTDINSVHFGIELNKQNINRYEIYLNNLKEKGKNINAL